MTEMVDRVARALWALRDSRYGGDKSAGTWEEIPDHWKQEERENARAAIKAMREPTPKMIDAGNDVSADAGEIWEPSAGISFDGPHCGLEVWRAMNDAALKEETAK